MAWPWSCTKEDLLRLEEVETALVTAALTHLWPELDTFNNGNTPDGSSSHMALKLDGNVNAPAVVQTDVDSPALDDDPTLWRTLTVT